jgi:hypothetical protein
MRARRISRVAENYWKATAKMTNMVQIWRRGLASLAGILTGLSASGQDGASWDLPVTAYGQPDVVIPICEVSAGGATWGLHLQHELIFDGRSYLSRFFIPEVESYLISSSPGVYVWRPPGGKAHKLYLDLDKPRLAHLVRGSGPDQYTVYSADDMTVFTYEHCRLFSVRKNRDEYSFKRDSTGTLRVTFGHVDRADAALLLTIGFNRSGLVTSVETSDRKLFGAYNDEMQLVKWETLGVGAPLAAFAYKSRLLTRVDQAGKVTPFEWGTPALAERFRPPVNLPPVVITDGQRHYSCVVGREWIKTRVTDVAGTLLLRWEVGVRTGTIRVFR